MRKYIILLTTTAIIMIFLLNMDHFINFNKFVHKNNQKENSNVIENKNQVNANEENKTIIDEKGTSNKSTFNNTSARKIPVLMYHSIEKGKTNLFVSPSTFESHIEYLIQKNYNFINFEDLQNGKIPSNPIILTFDDGYENIFTNVYPIIKKNNIKITVFLIVNSIGKNGYLSNEQISQMNDLVSFQSHTLSHLDLTSLDNNLLEKEIGLSKEKLQQIAKNHIIALSYPAGKFNERVIYITKKYFSYAVTTREGTYNLSSNPYTITRVRINKGDSVNLFSQKVLLQ